jgi:hypothetical protein
MKSGRDPPDRLHRGINVLGGVKVPHAQTNGTIRERAYGPVGHRCAMQSDAHYNVVLTAQNVFRLPHGNTIREPFKVDGAAP